MALPNAYTLVTNRIPDLFAKIRDGQAPEQVSQQLLKDWGLGSSNDRAFIRLLKVIGFLSPNGKPTQAYHDYRDHSRSKKVLGQALRENYADIFLIKDRPTDSDKNAIQGKFKTFHNVSDNVANLMAKTFLGLLALADVTPQEPSSNGHVKKRQDDDQLDHSDHSENDENDGAARGFKVHPPGLHYNIQIHLPPTKDVEVYNAIFKSLKEHLFEA